MFSKEQFALPFRITLFSIVWWLAGASPAWADYPIGVVAFSAILGWVGGLLIIGAIAWILAFFRRGPYALIGRQPLLVNTFESVVVYRRGAFERVLLSGNHWVNPHHAQFIRLDMRSEVFQITQGTITSDRIPVILHCTARIQIENPRAAVENAKEYRNEAYASLQSMIKKLGQERTMRGLLTDQDQFNAAVQARAADVLGAVGVRCISFELLHAEASSQLPDMETKEIGFQSH